MRYVVYALIALLLTPLAVVRAAEFHVALGGNDANPGTRQAPLRRIQRAADLARPGDVVKVHAGLYRERINPPRGGTSDDKRIVYQATAGEKVEIRGSEVAKNWAKVRGDVWKTVLPNSFFGDFNPYGDLIRGDWFNPRGREHHTGAVYLNGECLSEAAKLDDVMKPAGEIGLWFGRVGEKDTTIWAQFKSVNPNKQLVEINVRRAVFYPDKPGRNYITVRGFIMRHAATPWAPPTAEQVGLIGTHWSKGWIIENNVISHSRCSGITLGKYGDEWDNKSQSADAYNRTIRRALKNGWNKATIGGHIVRNNTISDCEQTGICGSLGGVFSQITNNHIYNIWVRRLFAGAEIGGIKIHASIDMLIRGNRIHNAGRALWMDWMAQGTRITGNLCYDNSTDDLFVEVDHGPFLVDNNIFLSAVSLRDWSEGGAFAHNMMAGRIESRPQRRQTPYHKAHSTVVAGLSNIKGGDHRFYNNLFIGRPRQGGRPAGCGLGAYGARQALLKTRGNVHYSGATPYAKEKDPLIVSDVDPKPEIVEDAGHVHLHVTLGPAPRQAATTLVTTELLGSTMVSGLGYENADGSPVRIIVDFFGAKRSKTKPSAGPFEAPAANRLKLKIR